MNNPFTTASADDFDFRETLYESRRTTVYAGTHRQTGLPIIAKVLRTLHPSRSEIQTLEREFSLISRFQDSGVVSHYALIDFQTTKAIIMADDDSQSLSRFLRENTMSLGEKLAIASSIARIIRVVHEQNIIIRDIKPDNFVIHPKSRLLKVIDFGLATSIQREVQENVNPDRLSGTLAYLSPEQTGRMNRSVDFRSDFYSFGVTLYELFTGDLPFRFDDPLSMVHAHIALKPPSPSEVDQSIPPAVSAVILKLMEKNPEQRYQSDQGIIDDLVLLENANIQGRFPAEFQPGSSDAANSFAIPERLYGRQAEQELLFEEFDRAAAGDMRLLLLSGPPGIGKSFLINELQKPLTERRGYFFAGKFDQHKREIPFSALIQALNQAGRQLLTESADRLARMKERLANHLGDNAWLLADLAPEWRLVLGECSAIPDLAASEMRSRFNAAISGTFTALAGRQHPVILFLDDLQWADQASINLLEHLMKNMSLRHFLLIGAYRSDETGPLHPLSIMFEKLRQEKVSWWREYQLPPLPNEAITSMLGDAMGGAGGQLDELAGIINERTGANPFFVKEFLINLHERGLIKHSENWQLDMAGIKASAITTNVLQLLLERIVRLDRITLELLKQMAAIGQNSEISLLEHRLAGDEAQILATISPAISLGLVIKQGSSLRFAHDRIHEAVYSLLDETERREAHHAIGSFLLQNASSAELQDRLFEIAHQLNLGLAAEKDERQLRRIAELNIQAGLRAKASTAYESALRYFQVADRLLPESSWQSDYPLMLRFQTDLSQTEYLSGANEAAEKRFDLILAHARNTMDKVQVFQTKMTYLIAVFRLDEAFATGIEALRLLGIRMPKSDALPVVAFHLIRTRLRLAFTKPESLADLPPVSSEKDQVIIKLLMALTEPAYHGKPDYLPLVIFAMLNFTLKAGLSDYSGYAFIIYGGIIGALLGDYAGGARFGQLATSLVDRTESNWLKGKVHFLNASMVKSWTKPLAESVNELVDSYKYSLEAGDILWAGYSLDNNLFYTFLRGDGLEMLADKFEKNHNQMKKLDQPIALESYDLWYQLVTNLMAEKPAANLSGTHFQESATIPGWEESQDRTGLGYYALCKLIQAWFQDDIPAALVAADGVKPYLDAMIGMAFVPAWNYFSSLALLADARTNPGRQRRRLAQVRKNLAQLGTWARHAPMNYEHKYLLIQAELMDLGRRPSHAGPLYDRALVLARKAGNLQDAAIISELAGEAFLRQGSETMARTYINEAWHNYQLWGNPLKANRLMERHRPMIQTYRVSDGSSIAGSWQLASASLPLDFSADSPSPTRSGSGTGSSGTNQLDLVAVMKSANALVGEIDLDRLFATLMRISMESAGAQRGLLVLRQADGLMVRSIGESDKTIEVRLAAIPLDQCAELDASIVTYVERTRNPLVYTQDNKRNQFHDSAYIRQHQPASILCLPIINHKRLQGLLYLENRQSSAAFSPQHLDTLQMLSSQIGIALENAQLFHDQRRITEVYSRFVPMEFLKLLGKESILDVKLADQVNRDMTIMFTDIRSFTSLSEQMTPAENFNFLNSYLARVSPVVRTNRGFIDKYLGDGLMALFPISDQDAVQAAIGIQRSLGEYNQGRLLAGHPPISVGIGLHSGSLMLGTIGESERMETTVISDSVNIASRLESLSKRYGVPILVSEQIIERTRQGGHYKSRFLDHVVLVGKNKPIAIHEILDGNSPEAFLRKTDTLGLYEEGLELYFRREFGKAAELFDTVVRKNPDDNPARLYLDRSTIFAVNPPPDDWTGVVILVDK